MVLVQHCHSMTTKASKAFLKGQKAFFAESRIVILVVSEYKIKKESFFGITTGPLKSSSAV